MGEVTCCERLKLVRRSVRGLSTCGKTGMLKSPSMMVLGDILGRSVASSSRNDEIELDGGL